MKDKLSASEALYGFVSWLTSREEVTSLSSKHDCARIADLVAEFCKTNDLEEPKDDWYKILVHPK